ncbi:MAG: chemotaxis protein CheW [Pseudomonadota bacterium]
MEVVDLSSEIAAKAASTADSALAAQAHTGPTFMVLTFELDSQRFAIPIHTVQEVIDPLDLTLVPNADPFAPGLINVRGTVVPVLSLQNRLGITARDHDEETRFIVIETTIIGEMTRFAIVADSVHEVVEFQERVLHASPTLGLDWPSDYIDGIINRDDTLTILINTQRIFSPDPFAPGLE